MKLNMFDIETPYNFRVIMGINIHWELNWDGFSHAKNVNHVDDVGMFVLSMTSSQGITQSISRNPMSYKLVEYKSLPIIKLSKTLTGDIV